jgi:hypothetical protein
MAMYYTTILHQNSPRQITFKVEHAVGRVKSSANPIKILKYDHHFDPGELENKIFWETHNKAVESLGNTQLKINC